MLERKRKLDCANGREKADLVLKNGNVLNVFTEEVLKADVAICGDTIVGVGEYEGKEEIDCTGKYLVPGFIDAHMHIESCMAAPGELAKVLAKAGTTTIIADPHKRNGLFLKMCCKTSGKRIFYGAFRSSCNGCGDKRLW